MKKNKEEFSFKDFVDLFMPKLWLIVLVALILGLALGGYSAFLKGDTYTSTARLMVAKNNNASLNSTDIALAADMVETYEYIIFTDNFLTQVIDEMKTTEEYKKNNWSISVKFLKSAISIEQCGDTEVFDAIVTTSDATLSYVISYALANQICNTLPSVLPYEDGVNSTVVDNPALAVAPNSKHVVRNAVIGVLGGAILAMVAIFVHSVFDLTIREKRDLEENFDIPVLGVIPRYDIEEEAEK